MAIVNVDYSEFETLKNRVKELEETVKEKDKTIASLKDGSRVIIRKEVQIEYETFSDPFRRMHGFDQDPLYSQDEKPRRTIETSESYVGFEEVRLKVEEHMKDEVKRSIHDRNMEKQAYAEKKNKLDNEYNGRKAELKKVYEQKERNLEEKYARMVGDFETEKNRVFNKLPNIVSMATDLRDELTKIRFFKPKLAIKLANDIIDYSSKKETGSWTD